MTKSNLSHPTRSITLTEKIDDLSLNYEEDIQVFAQLNWLNNLSWNDYLIRKGFRNISKNLKKNNTHHLSIVDLGCGDGKNLIDISKYLKKKGIKTTCIGIDFNEHLIEKAKSTSKEDSIKFLKEDILSVDFELPQCDVLFSSQFMYRFTDGSFVTFIEKNISKIRIALFSTELQRSRFNQYAFNFIGKLLRLNPVVVKDGFNAIGRAWKCKEMRELLENIDHTEVKTKKMFHRFSILVFC